MWRTRKRARPFASTPTSAAIHSITATLAIKSADSATTRPAPSAKSRYNNNNIQVVSITRARDAQSTASKRFCGRRFFNFNSIWIFCCCGWPQYKDPYLEIPEATTHELTSCYNVTIDCRSSDMVVRVKTNRIFTGKLYAKERPNSCVTDVSKGLEFELRLGYQDLGCDVKQEGLGKFFTEVVIQVLVHLSNG